MVDKIYDRLEVGGVFAVGAAANEHIFIAPDDTPDDETIRFGDTAAYKKQLKAMEDTLLYYENAENYSKLANAFNNSDFKQYMPNQEEMKGIVKANVDDLMSQAEVRILKKGVIERALEKDGRFKPVQYSPVEGFNDIKVPTVWVKVK